MSQAQSTSSFGVSYCSNSQMRHQLMREIGCLERHLNRLKANGYMKDQSTLDTYKEMILSRKQLLSDLS